MKVRRPDHRQDHLNRDDQTPTVNVIHLDVVLGNDFQGPDDHVTPRKCEANRLVGSRMLVQHRPERFGSTESAFRGVVGGEKRPACGVEPYVGRLARAFHGCEVIATRSDGAAEAVPTEFDGDTIASVDELLCLVGESETPSSLHLGQSLVFGSLFGPFTAGALTKLGSEVRIRGWSFFHGFSRSRHLLSDTR